MACLTTDGIVLRRNDYRESDRIITLLTPRYGRMELRARGAKKTKSPLLAATELFTLGEYVVYQGRGNDLLTNADVRESFYPLREDISRLSHASLMLSAAEKVVQKNEDDTALFILLARSLSRLCYADLPMDSVTAAYLLHFAAVSGYKPRLNHCAACGRALNADEPALFDIESGGAVCMRCAEGYGKGQALTASQLRWLRQVLTVGVEKTALPDEVPLPLLIRFVEYQIESRLPKIL